LAFFNLSLCCFGQNDVVGIFEGQSDIGTLLHPGAAEYDAAKKTYTLTSSGDNMWAAEDDFHFVWKTVSGDVTITADISFPTSTGNPHKKGALMIRRTLDQDSDYVDAALHLAGLTSIQSRDQKGSITREVQSYMSSPKHLRLEKRGDYFFMFVAGDDGVFHLSGGSMKLVLNEPFYVGLAACAHDKNAVEQAAFSNVDLVAAPPAPGKLKLYSTLETQLSDRKAVYVTEGRLESPDWLKDGKSQLFDTNGHIERIPVAGGKPELIDTGKVKHVGSHHGVSPDGTTLALTEEPKGKGLIYTVPIAGGTPVRVTKQSPSYFHDWSPDGKTILYTGRRKGKPGIFTIPAAGGAETALAAGDGDNENPVYSPDGKYIYFDSDRTGRTQIWRMRADGTGQEQVTTDDFVNWLPHVSPDGKQVAFLSCDKSVANQPEDNDVKIRSMTLTTKAIRLMANLLGGPGTFDGQPWAPDSRTLSYVSYQMLPAR
jgi:Tol biopolymer transport system component